MVGVGGSGKRRNGLGEGTGDAEGFEVGAKGRVGLDDVVGVVSLADELGCEMTFTGTDFEDTEFGGRRNDGGD